MKKSGILIAALFLMSTTLWAQEYKIKASANQTLALIEINSISVEGYDGNEIVISTESNNSSDEERAKGLTAINGMGLKDNSGIGLSVTEKDGIIEVVPLSKRGDKTYLVKIPKGMKLKYEHSSSYGRSFNIKNVTGEIEVSSNHNSIFLEDITGPVTINTVHGNVDAIFTSVNQANPTSIISAHGLIDVTFPENSKINIKMSSNWGELYTDMNIAMDESEDGMKEYSSKVSGKINGGGVEVDLSSTHGTVYLRKKN